MSDRQGSHPGGSGATPQGTGSEERVLLDRQGTGLLRSLLDAFWHIKLRLQFSGWLQYIPLIVLALLVFLVAGLVYLVGNASLAMPFVGIGVFVLAAALFEVVTIKFRLHPRECIPKRKDAMGMFDLMRSRQSCRSFQTRKLTHADHSELMSYVRLRSEAPMLSQLSIRFEYVSAPLTVWPAVNASEFLVAIVPKAYNRLAVIDVGRSLQKIVIDATRMGLGTCWIGPGAEQSSIARHLGDRFDPERDHIICVCALGYESSYVPLLLRIFNWQLHHRLPLSSLFFADSAFETPLDMGAYPFSRFGRNYEVCQWSPSSYNGQTTRCVAVMAPKALKNGENGGEEQRLARFDFYATIESRYYAPVALGIWCANWEMGCEALGIRGHFVVLPAKERGEREEEGRPRLPRYDISWVLDEDGG